MKELQVLYDSNHGHTKKVADLFENSQSVKEDVNITSDVVLFLCPTYGDEELPLAMEDFLCNLRKSPRQYVVCELGNYYGYDDFRFGAAKLIKHCLEKLGWTEFYPSFSMDSMPNMDWEPFNEWKRGLEHELERKCLCDNK